MHPNEPTVDEAGPVAPAELTPEQWQTLEALWAAILGLESQIDAARQSLESLRAEMEAAFRQSLNVEEKLHAMQSDVARWTDAKNRVHYALPKLREFLHRATWAKTLPERKRLEEVIESHVKPRVPFGGANQAREQLEHLQKARQVLQAQGNAVAQECRGIVGEVQRALSSLRRNAAERARKQRESQRQKGKYF